MVIQGYIYSKHNTMLLPQIVEQKCSDNSELIMYKIESTN